MLQNRTFLTKLNDLPVTRHGIQKLHSEVSKYLIKVRTVAHTVTIYINQV